MGQHTTIEDRPEPEVDATVIALLEEADLIAAAAAAADATLKPEEQAPAGANVLSATRRAYLQVIDLALSAVAANGIRRILDTQTVIKVARHVASKKTRNLTDAQVLEFIADNHSFRRSLGGHLFEALDEQNLKTIHNLRKQLGLSEGRFLKLYPEHNRRGLDGVYKGAVRAGEPLFAQHKASANINQLRKAAAKTGKSVRAKTELVILRDVHVGLNEIKGLKRVRHAGPSMTELRAMIDHAADPGAVRRTGAAAVEKFTLKCSVGAAALSGGMSFVLDLRHVRRGEMTAAAAVENALWNGAEAALSTAATGAVTVCTTPLLAAGVSILVESTWIGTTAAAAGLATAGPAVLVIGTGLAVGYGVQQTRRHLRARASAT